MITTLLSTLASLTLSASIEQTDVAQVTAKILASHNTQGSFVLYDEQRHQMLRSDADRSRRPMSPASTFKILNGLIALQTGVVKDPQQVMVWDGVQRSVKSWNADQTLESGIRNSAVWAFQWIARQVGEQSMQHYLDISGYGNGQIGPQIDQFWLDGSLRISPEDQVKFLRQLYFGSLPFAPEHLSSLREILVQERNPVFTLSGKTGWSVSQEPHIGWFVGYLEKSPSVWFFALNVDIHPDGGGRDRVAISREILLGLGLIPEG